MSFTYIKADVSLLDFCEETYLPKALAGDYEALSQLTLILASAVEQGVLLSPKLSSFLGKALRDISCGKDPAEAFHIRRKRGQKDLRASIERSIMCVGEVKALRHKNPDMRLDDAFESIAQKMHVSFDKVKADWRDYRNKVELNKDGDGYCWAFENNDK